MNLVTISIVLFNNNYSTIKKAIDSFLALEIDFKLYLIDNSPTNELQSLKIDTRIEYYHNPSNPGFGFAHNIAILHVAHHLIHLDFLLIDLYL